MVAEDQRINLEALKMNLKDMGLYRVSNFNTNGQQACNSARKIIATALAQENQHLPIKPIRAMLLDF